MATQTLTFSQAIADFFGGAKRDARVAAERRAEMVQTFDEMRDRVQNQAKEICEASQPVRAEKYVTENLEKVRDIRERMVKTAEAARKKMSWWDMLGATEQDYTGIDACIAELEVALQKIRASGEVEAVQGQCHALASRALARLDRAEKKALQSIPASRHVWYDGNKVAKASLLLSAASVPVSAWGDISSAGNIYNTLRGVNGNFAGMTDVDIWMQTLMMPAESLAGLVSLTKGAYFERLVADSTGGTLFENFNHPDTDIVIDGVAYQLKATGSVDYINSVPDHIPVISTSEVSFDADSIDSGIALAEIERATELALGGTVFDLGDTAFDAALTGVGALGLFATLRGVNHALRTYDSSQQNGIEAVAEGVGVAITLTAKSFVDTAELGYTVITSRPSRFAGRLVVNLAMWTGKKIVGKPKADIRPDRSGRPLLDPNRSPSPFRRPGC